jgi:indolepyruvate ferredoxin oxidoreductase beta subunit
MRWSHYLRAKGVAMVNQLRLTPPIVSSGLFDYPDDPVASIRGRGLEVHDFDAGEIARELGNLRLVNTIMLGAISDNLPFSAETLKECIVTRFRVKKPALAELNAKAFDLGKAAGKSGKAG